MSHRPVEVVLQACACIAKRRRLVRVGLIGLGEVGGGAFIGGNPAGGILSNLNATAAAGTRVAWGLGLHMCIAISVEPAHARAI